VGHRTRLGDVHGPATHLEPGRHDVAEGDELVQRFSVKLRADRTGLVTDADLGFDGAVWNRRTGCCC